MRLFGLFGLLLVQRQSAIYCRSTMAIKTPASVLLLFLAQGQFVTSVSAECCALKTVGDYSYTLTTWEGAIPDECKDSCAYTKDGYGESLYCFAPGYLNVVCLCNPCSECNGEETRCENTPTCFYDTVNEVCSPKDDGTGTEEPNEPCEPCSECNGEETRCENTPTCLYDTVNKVCSPKDDDCPEQWLMFGSNCYTKPKGISTDWAGAESHCQGLLTEAHLASIHSAEEMQFVHDNFRFGQHIWLGGSDRDEEGSWVWTDGSQWAYTAWYPDEPNNVPEDCLVYRGSDNPMYSWHDNHCDRSDGIGPLCKAPLVSKPGTLVFEKKQEFILTRNNKLGEVDFLGEEYTITFQLLLTAGTPATTSSTPGSIIHFTIGGDCCGVPGDRTPGLWVYNGTEIVLRSTIDGQANYGILPGQFPDLPAISLNTWHTVEISQLSNGSEIVFYMKLDGSTIATKINNQPRSFKNVKIFAGDDWFPAAFGKMKNLIVKTKL